MAIKIGSNGNYFFQKGTRWVDTRLLAKAGKSNIAKTANLVVVCEPFVQLPTTKKIDKKHCFYVSDEFLAILNCGPSAKKTKMGNAYIFGPTHTGYINYGYFPNNAGMIGLVVYVPRISNFTEQEKIILDPLLHNSKKFIAAARDMGRDILFSGQTTGGNLGCTIMIHLNESNEIDGLILENYCVFPLLEHVIREEFNAAPPEFSTLEFREKMNQEPASSSRELVLVPKVAARPKG